MIAILLSSISREGGGIFTAVRDVVEALTGLGVGIRVYGASDRHTGEDSHLWAGIDTWSSTVTGPKGFGFQRTLMGELLRQEHKIMHVHGLWMYPALAALYWNNQTRRPYVISPHGMLDAWALEHSKWKKRLALSVFQRRSLERATALHVLCEQEADSVRTLGLKARTFVIPNGVDEGDLNEKGRIWSERNATRDRRRMLLYLGRIHEKKGIAELISAWRQLNRSDREARDGWVLRIHGWGTADYVRHIHRIAHESDLGEGLEIRGPVFGAEKDEVLYQADALVLPSKSEGLPVVVLEAWTRGTPAILTPQCNLHEGVRSGAAIETTNDASSLLAALTLLVTEMNDGDRLTMGQKGNHLVRQKYSIQAVAEQYKNMYQSLA